MQLAPDNAAYRGKPLTPAEKQRLFPLICSSVRGGGVFVRPGTERVEEIKYVHRDGDSAPYPNKDFGTTLFYCDNPKRQLEAHYLAFGDTAPMRVLMVHGRDDYDRGLYVVVEKQSSAVDADGGNALALKSRRSSAPLRFVLKKVLCNNGDMPKSAVINSSIDNSIDNRTNSGVGSSSSSSSTSSSNSVTTNAPDSATPSSSHGNDKKYRDTQFRSRLEVAHARLYDALELRWTYERHTLSIESPRYGDMRTREYTPDFCLCVLVPLLDAHVPRFYLIEVKPAWPHDDELRLCAQAALAARAPLLLAYGQVCNPHARTRRPARDARNYAHSHGLRFAIFDERGALRCSDAVLKVGGDKHVLIEPRAVLSDDRVYHPWLERAFDAARRQ